MKQDTHTHYTIDVQDTHTLYDVDVQDRHTLYDIVRLDVQDTHTLYDCLLKTREERDTDGRETHVVEERVSMSLCLMCL